jgi:chromosome segregation ATPase
MLLPGGKLCSVTVVRCSLQVGEMQRQNEQLHAELQEANGLRQSLQDRLSQAEIELQRSCNASEGALYDATQAQADVIEHQQDQVGAQAAGASDRDGYAHAVAAAEHLQQESAESKRQAAASAEQANKLTAEANAWQALLDSRSAEKAALETELAGAKAAITELEQRCQEAEASLAASQIKLTEVQAQLVESNHARAAARAECAQMQQQLVDAETQLGKALASSAGDRGDVDAAAKALDSTAAALATLRASHTALQMEAAQHAAHCQELQAANATLEGGLVDQQQARESELATFHERNGSAVQATDALGLVLTSMACVNQTGARADIRPLLASANERLRQVASGEAQLAPCLDALHAVAQEAQRAVDAMVHDSIEAATMQASKLAAMQTELNAAKGEVATIQDSASSMQERLMQAKAAENAAREKVAKLEQQVCSQGE